MNGDCYVARSAHVAARVLGDEAMIMSAGTSTLFTLNEAATLIWEAADGTTPLLEIVKNKICELYEVTLEVALKDTENLVEQLAGHGILVLSNKPLTGVSPKGGS